jgi:hypothetical protein
LDPDVHGSLETNIIPARSGLGKRAQMARRSLAGPNWIAMSISAGIPASIPLWACTRREGVAGVIDGGGNKARRNGNFQQCPNIACR